MSGTAGHVGRRSNMECGFAEKLIMPSSSGGFKYEEHCSVLAFFKIHLTLANCGVRSCLLHYLEQELRMSPTDSLPPHTDDEKIIGIVIWRVRG